MSRSRQPPLVTGISPNEGISWTKVTIRGENLGTGPTDLIGLTICGHNCLLTAEWMSASKIVCRVGQAKNDKGDIIVTTKSGGRGTSTVSFKLLKPEKIGILDQSAVWVDEMNYYDMRTDRNKGIPPLSLRPANPLGIEIDKGRFPQKDLEALFPGMSADFTSENFSAAWYLIENHSTTSFDQLKMAVMNLKKQANKKNEGSLAYVKGGLSTFFEAQDALSAIHQKLEADGTEKVEGSMTQKLENVLNRASNTADTLFQEVLGRKDKADSTRNALNVLQRFKFLFNLPLNIERNIQKGDYDVVINDYEKAKSLFGKTEVQVFKKYYAEVETRIEALRDLLLDKLLETPSTLHDQKRYIRYLSDLHAFGDPAWQCIGAQHKWILQLMHNCKESYIKEQKDQPARRKTIPLSSVQGNSLLHSPMLDLDSDVRPSPLGHLSQTASLKRGSSFQSGRDETWRCKAPQQVAFVEKLTKLVVSQLPNFWKLWISYVNGSLFSETAEKSGQMERSKKNARQRQNDFKKMVQEMMQSLVKLIRGALLPFSLREGELRQYGGWEMKSELSGQWLTHVIQTVRLSYESLTALEIPNDMLHIIQDLILDLRVRCIMVTLQHTAEDVKRLAEKEDWVVDNEGLTSLISMESLKELDQRLFETYIELKADPIVGSLEPGIYAGYFDWKDCLIPTGVRNYLKEALVNIIAVHAEVFTISKELVSRVLSRIVESVAEELSRLMQCVSSFSKYGALQARLEICALRDAVAVYLTPESNSSFKQALEALPQLLSGADKKLLEELLNKFKSSMHLQLTCFQASSALMKT
ncbi:exocyst complex component 2 isoform X3 [Carettochelys insculpta]|uniref:exocyst complex component 2 isoform X3 n=1 Tax=Carettochelys insculpta TaxID=44489 RepID=UPI003EBB4062